MTRCDGVSRRQFLAVAAAAGGSALLPSAALAAPFQDPVVNPAEKDGKPTGREKVAWQVRPFPMQQVRLGEGPCKLAQEADRQYLRSLPPDPSVAHLSDQRRHCILGATARWMGSSGL